MSSASPSRPWTCLTFSFKAHRDGRDIHGCEIEKMAHRSGPTVCGVIDRLEDAKLVEGLWEHQDPQATGPRRWYCRLTGAGVQSAVRLLAKRRQVRPRTKIPAPGPGLIAEHGRTT